MAGNMLVTKCGHGGLIDDDGTVSCRLCDWCTRCERVTAWSGEACRECGRIWGHE